jgi:GH25 family lysozyme M1 (1,4-beta-N-acetylmuramidase)
MTFGIDISAYQYGINLAKAKTEGVQFVIVKASGFNTGSYYVADRYHENIDAVINAKIQGKGHYYIVGKGNVLAQAKYFVDHLYKFNKDHDVLGLDNEPLNSNGTHWDQDDCMTFLTYVHKQTGINTNRLWLYCPAAQTRENGPWNRITDTHVRIWWVAYGNQPSGHTPDHTPALNGKIARWDVHQFTEQARVAGQLVDGNYSKKSVYELFNLTPPQPAVETKAPTTTTTTTSPYSVAVKPASGSGWRFDLPSMAMTSRIQRALGARRRYSGPANGVFNLATAKGVQTTTQNVGYQGPVDGKIGEAGCEFIQRYAQAYGGYAGPIDKDLGQYTWAGFAVGLERP